MPQLSTLEQVANIVIRRTMAEVGHGSDLLTALERAYPFPNDNYCREIWEQALDKNNVSRGSRLERRPPVPQSTANGSGSTR